MSTYPFELMTLPSNGGHCLKAFLSSTFLDLVKERKVVLEALHRKQTSTLAMEYFLATPSTPRETALENLRNSDVMILVIGFKAGTLLSDGSGSTYTSAEYDELLRSGKTHSYSLKYEAKVAAPSIVAE